MPYSDDTNGDHPRKPPTLLVDWTLYEDYLRESDASDDDKRALIETLWSIVVGFVDMGFGVHPVQQACEHRAKNIGDDDSSMLELLNSEQDKNSTISAVKDFASSAGREDS